MYNRSLLPIQFDLYDYDFSACSYNILKNINYDLSEINFEDKKIRNIQIGLLQKENPLLINLLNDKTENLKKYYKDKNGISEENIIWEQRDGFVTNKKLLDTTSTMPIDFRGKILRSITNLKKDKAVFIFDNGLVDVKGVSHKPMDISFYNTFLKIDFFDKNNLINGLELFRKEILKSKNIKWFSREDEGFIFIPIKKSGIMKFNKTMINSIQIDSVDKEFMWENYVWPFAQTLILYYGK